MPHPTPPSEPFTEHLLVFMTLTEGRSNDELERIAGLLEAVGACMDAAAEAAEAAVDRLGAGMGRNRSWFTALPLMAFGR